MKEPIFILLITLMCMETVKTVPVVPKSTKGVKPEQLNPSEQEDRLLYYLSKTPKFRTTIDQNNIVKMEAGTVFRDNTLKPIPGKTSLKPPKGNYAPLLKSAEKEGPLDSFVNRMECSICKLVVMLVQTLLAQGKTRDEIASALTVVCTQLHIEDRRVCVSVIQEFKDEVLTVLDKLALSPSEVCGVMLGGDCAHAYNPFDRWNVTLPDTPKPPVTPKVPPKPGSPQIRIVQLSDIHVDLDYKPGSNALCGEPLCCHADDGPVKGAPAGQWGDYRNCDTPTWTLENLLKRLATQEKFDYIYWTGDLPSHRVWNQTRNGQQRLQGYLTELLKKYFPNTLIFPSIGNHESAPVNSFPPPFVKGDQSIDWLYSTLASNWSEWLPKSSVPDVLKGGYYSVLVKPGFRVVSVNTNYCNNENWWLLLNTTDPADELQWLIKVLQSAEDNKEKVHILGHIPTGIDNCLKAWSWNYYKIINRYESTVTGQFFGHTHADSVSMYYDDVTFQRPVSVAYISPSVTPYAGGLGTNPSYRVYQVDGGYEGASWEVLNHQTYMFNLSEANLTPDQPPHWYQEYDAKMAYNMTSLYPADWDRLLQKMETDDRLFNMYYQYFYHGHPPSAVCDQKCQVSLLCAARCGRSYDQGHLCKGIQGQGQ